MQARWFCGCDCPHVTPPMRSNRSYLSWAIENSGPVRESTGSFAPTGRSHRFYSRMSWWRCMHTLNPEGDCETVATLVHSQPKPPNIFCHFLLFKNIPFVFFNRTKLKWHLLYKKIPPSPSILNVQKRERDKASPNPCAAPTKMVLLSWKCSCSRNAIFLNSKRDHEKFGIPSSTKHDQNSQTRSCYCECKKEEDQQPHHSAGKRAKAEEKLSLNVTDTVQI